MSDTQPNSPQQATEGAEDSAPSSILSKANKTDLKVAILIVGLCILAWWETGNFAPVSPGMVGYVIAPAVFPRMILALIIALTVFLPFEQHILGEEGKVLDKDRSDKIQPIAYYTALLLIGMVIAHPYLGSFLTIFAICLLMPLMWGGP